MSKTKTKRPSKKADAAADEKRQPRWLQRPMPVLESETPPSPERSSAAPQLLSKHDVCRIVGVSYVTLWVWMRADKFPRSRSVGGRSMWLSSEVERWVSELPRTRLKGDEAVA